MAGLIRREDIDEVRSRVNIGDVIGQQVTLKSAGVGSKKGLCPFHDERTPSFHVRGEVGLYHCFGCGESGDVFTFLQKIDHVTFTDAVERLAGQVGVRLRYEDGEAPTREPAGKRQRLLEAHQVAAAFFAEQLNSPEAAPARQFLSERGFSRSAAESFGVGYAPRGWDALLRHMRGRGFTEPELADTGMFSQGSRGPYDRFRGRLIWPIRDVTGDVIGFGARKLHDDDKGPKYLNTPETPLYKKNEVLYGIDVAKREIGRQRQIVVVEGYTDVMACHLAGVTTAVATCGTSFGTEHIKLARRMLSDDSAHRGEVIFLFDGDEAGRQAALRAFNEDQRFVAQTFVAIEQGGLDPCELRQTQGDDSVVDLVKSRRPLFEFAIASTLSQVDLGTVEGRVGALRAAAPVVAGIRDNALRPGYARYLAGKIGIPVEDVLRAVQSASRRGGEQRPEEPPSSDGSDPVLEVERQALQVALQYPLVVPPKQFDSLTGEVFRSPGHHAVHDSIRAAGGIAQAHRDPANWAKNVLAAAPDVIAGMVSELAVRPLPMTENDTTRYCRAILLKLFQLDITRVSADLHGRLQRLDADADADESAEVLAQLQDLEERKRALRSE